MSAYYDHDKIQIEVYIAKSLNPPKQGQVNQSSGDACPLSSARQAMLSAFKNVIDLQECA